MQKKLIHLAAIAAAIAALGAPSLTADQVTLRLIGNDGLGGDPVISGNYFFDPVGSLTGVEIGDYAAKTIMTTAGGALNYWTFCLEYNEHFNDGYTYYAGYSDAAVAGGGGAVNGRDPISARTANIYEQFALGLMTPVTWNNQLINPYTTQGAAYIQRLIWWLEAEITTVPTISNNPFYNVGLGADPDQGSAVMVLNLTRNGQRAQDQLILTSVPVPDGGTTALLLGASLLGLAVVNRRRK